MIAPFSDRVASLHLVRKASQILQVNIGRLCNLACHHCHVEAGPKRTEKYDGSNRQQGH